MYLSCYTLSPWVPEVDFSISEYEQSTVANRVSVKIQDRTANSATPEKMPHYEPSYLCAHCLQRYVAERDKYKHQQNGKQCRSWWDGLLWVFIHVAVDRHWSKVYFFLCMLSSVRAKSLILLLLLFIQHLKLGRRFGASKIDLILCMLDKNFSRKHFEIFFLFFLENRIWHFMQIVSNGDNLHEVSDPIF